MIIILCDVLTLCFTVNLYEKKTKKDCFGVLIFPVKKKPMFQYVDKKS